MTDAFRIELLDQGWLLESEIELPEGWLLASEAEDDLCSHGHLRLTIGGVEVVGEKESYGISESALAMLRTLAADHTPQAPVADRIIFHGCGTMLMMGCPIGADYSVRHRAGIVIVGDVVRYDTTDERKAVRFPGLGVELPAADYRSEVLRFALSARGLFSGAIKHFADDFDAEQYETFWTEFDRILANPEHAA